MLKPGGSLHLGALPISPQSHSLAQGYLMLNPTVSSLLSGFLLLLTVRRAGQRGDGEILNTVLGASLPRDPQLRREEGPRQALPHVSPEARLLCRGGGRRLSRLGCRWGTGPPSCADLAARTEASATGPSWPHQQTGRSLCPEPRSLCLGFHLGCDFKSLEFVLILPGVNTSV